MLIPRRSVRTSQPQYAVGINWSNSLSRGITSVYLPSVGVSLICSGPTTQGGTSRVTANSGVGRRFQGGVSTDFIGYGTADSLFGQNRADGSIVSLLRYTDTTLRDAQLFGQSSDGGASNRILVQHWSDGKIYFDWGGATNGAGRISATVSKTLNPFVISAISSASSGKKLWIDKQKVAENGADFTAFPSSSAVFRLGNIYSTWISDACEIYLAVTWNRPLSDLEYTSFVDNPWQIFEDEEEYLFIPAAGGGSSVSLVVSEALHGHVADSPTFSMDTYLAVAESLHSHAADNLTLSATGAASLVVQDAAHGHVADGVALTTQWLFSVADAFHGHAADNVALSTRWLLAVSDATHGHIADNLTLDTSNTTFLTVQDAAHSHGTDAVGLTLDTWLAIVDAAHAHAADAPTLSASVALLIAEALHAHYADALVLSFPGETTLTPADISAIAAAVLAALNATTGTRTMGEHLQIQTAVLAGTETGAGTSHITFTDGTATVEADVPLPGVVGNRTNVVISV